MTKRIIVCDDRFRDAEKLSASVQQVCPRGFIVEPKDPDEFFKAVSNLEERRRAARDGDDRNDVWENGIFDGTAVVVVDYDLLKLKTSSYVTGEDVAYLCRCYSRCGLIIALNQYGTNSFDLTLRGHPESHADLNIGGEQLGNPGLWSETWCGRHIGFRPWYWPLLPAAYRTFEGRVKDVTQNLGEEVLTYLGFDDEVIATLPRSTREFLGPGKSPEKMTFEAFVHESGNGLRPKDKPRDEESIARIASARLWKWLERLVLAGQDILVDAPHLVSRYPSLLKGGARSLATWNRTVSFANGASRLDAASIRKFQFRKSNWLSRPAWLWKSLSGSERIQEVADPGSRSGLDFVFCEDVSHFLPLESARDFVADLSSPFVRRFVVNPKAPAAQEMGVDVGGVDYEPAVRFSF